MAVIQLIVLLALIGLLTWAVTTAVPMTDGIKKLIGIVALVVCIFIVLEAFGLLPATVPRLR